MYSAEEILSYHTSVEETLSYHRCKTTHLRGDDDHDQDCDSNVEHDDHNVHDDDDKDGVEGNLVKANIAVHFSLPSGVHSAQTVRCTNKRTNSGPRCTLPHTCEEMKASVSQNNMSK